MSSWDEPRPLSRAERLAMAGTILIWLGAVLLAVGMALAYRHVRVETLAYAGVMPIGFAPSEVATTVVTPTITAEAAVSVVTPAASATRFQREPRP
ncbi:MAG: hypothetical protein SVX38_10250, partial [Chloroflexota bacterium]|nr:hypothetical protein [Chloroflexota bacterium]